MMLTSHRIIHQLRIAVLCRKDHDIVIIVERSTRLSRPTKLHACIHSRFSLADSCASINTAWPFNQQMLSCRAYDNRQSSELIPTYCAYN